LLGVGENGKVLKILSPPDAHDFHYSVTHNAFVSKAATNAVVVGTLAKSH